MTIDSPVSSTPFLVAPACSLGLVEATPAYTAQQLLALSIQRLVSQFDAVAVAHFIQGSDSKLSYTMLCGEVEVEIRPKAAALVAQAIATQEVQSQILSSRHQHFVVAAPLPCTDGDVIAVLFRQSSSGIDSHFFESRTREATLVAAYRSLVKIGATSLTNQSTLAQAFGNEPTPPSTANANARQHSLRVRFTHFLAGNKQNPVIYAAATVAVLLVGLVPWQHSVHCDVVCEPAHRRFVAAPFDGKLLKSLVGPGDQVELGQILAMLDGGELQSQIASLQAKMDQALQRRSAALSSGDGSKAELERLEVQYLGSEIRLLDDRKRNLEVRSPIAGVVVSGDLERAEGVPLKVGENLFEIAPLDQLVAEIAIPEADVLHIASGMKTNIKLDAKPGLQYQAMLARIHPRNEIRKNASVFVGEALIDNSELSLRPGMNGTASIEAGRRPIAWLVFHRPYEALRELIGW